jgi:hypothetical protein
LQSFYVGVVKNSQVKVTLRVTEGLAGGELGKAVFSFQE